MQEIISYLKMNDVKFEESVGFPTLSSIRLGGTAAVVAYPDSISMLTQLLRFLSEKAKKFKVVGKMSNVLPPDTRYDGLILKTTEMNNYSFTGTSLCAECGVSVPTLAYKTALLGISGLEELSGIPGTVGGLVAGNAGAFGKSVADVLSEATVYDAGRGTVLTLRNDELDFSYRNSIFKEKPLFLLSAVFDLSPSSKEEVRAKILKYREERMSKQPYDYSSLGSVFKRPEGAYAAKLIDDLGLRGYRIGGAMISEKHAGFIVNLGDATSSDVKRLVQYVEERVLTEYGITLEREIEYL